jgi:diacylglycerol kinase (ATP)
MATWVVVNPRAGSGSAARKAPRLARSLHRAGVEHELVETRSPGDATRIALEARDAGVDTLIVLGGDGTLNEVCQAYVDSDARPVPGPELVIAPGGTGGDFRRTFDFGESVEETVRRVVRGQTRPIDLGILDLTSAQGETVSRAFVNVTSFGIGGLVDRLVNRSSKWWGGRAAFLLGGLRAWTVYRNTPVRIRVDGSTWLESPVFNVALANGRYHGGGMQIAPTADPGDGLFDVVALCDLSRAEAAAIMRKVYQGRHVGSHGVRATRGAVVDAEPIRRTDEVLIDLDGETPGRLPARARIVPSALHLRV